MTNESEVINTNSFEINPQGHYLIEVEQLNKKIRTSKRSGKEFVLYELKGEILDCDFTPDTNDFKISMFPNMMGEVLKALGAKEKSAGNYIRPTQEELQGKQIEFELIHQEDSRGQLREVLIEVKPFVGAIPEKPKSMEEVAWDEK